MHGTKDVRFCKENEQTINVGREQQEEVVLFLTAHLPEGFPRVSQPQAGSTETFRHTFISAVFASSSSYSLSVASISCMCGLFAPLSFSISHPHSLFPFSLAPMLRFGWIWGEACFCWCVCANVQLLCALCCIYMLRLTPRVQRLVTTDLVRLQSFCQASLLLHNRSPYLLSLRRSKNRAGQASNHGKCGFQFWFWYALNPKASFKVILVLLTKICCSCSFR